jgi:Arc/MetJ family transcription regulator
LAEVVFPKLLRGLPKSLRNTMSYTRNQKMIHILETDVRTNIVLDENLIERAQKLTGIKTKREVVQEALRSLILLREQAEVRQFRGNLKWEGDLNEMRQARVLEH